MEGFTPARAAQAKLKWRDHAALLAKVEAKPTLSIGVTASFTAESLRPFLGAPLIEAGQSPAIHVGPFNQLFQACLDPRSHFEAEVDVIVLLFRLEDLVLEDLLAYTSGDKSALARAGGNIDLLVAAFRGLREKFTGTIIVNTPPFPAHLPASAINLGNAQGLGTIHRALASRFVEQMAAVPSIRVCDFDALQREVGLAASFDSRQWYLYRQPFTDRFLWAAGAQLSRMITALKRSPAKCIVLDCDNTLWGGVIGEDGLSGIKLGDEFPGTGYRDFQRLLLFWRQQGAFLAVASKNNEAEVFEVFDKHTGMLLRREHISAWQVHWNPKADGIPLIAKALNIGTDSLVFIDDNPMEIDYMRQARPEVHSILLPEDPADIVQTLRDLPLFDRLEITNEDRSRADMMAAEHQREALVGSLSPEDFKKALGLTLDFYPAGTEDLDRVTQLINKTNQFNLTTIRRTLDEVRALAQSPSHRIFCLKVSDKFGDYGLTGVVIAEIAKDKSELIIDTLLLSCRVLGRGVETALLAALADEARAAGAETVVGSFIASAKNAPAANFLPDHGFQKRDDGQWQVAVASIPALSTAITLNRAAQRVTTP